MQLVIASGKGGTGKTTVATNLAWTEAYNQKIVFMDLDVEEPNAAIFLKPDFYEQISVVKKVPSIDKEKCTFCGKCAEACVFNALSVLPQNVLVFEDLCHACGLCKLVCPFKAIKEVDYEIGVIKAGTSLKNQILFYEGTLNIGETSTPEVIAAVKKQIRKDMLHILDAPPGTSCSVIEALKEADFCLLVAEPTPFGASDLSLMIKLVKNMGIPSGIIINQWEKGNNLIDNLAEQFDIPVIAHIPFDTSIAAAYARGMLFAEQHPEYRRLFQAIIPKIKELIKK